MSWLSVRLRLPALADTRPVLRASLHASASGEVVLWSEVLAELTVPADGWFTCVLGRVSPLSADILGDRPRWLALRMADPLGPELAPRTLIDPRLLAMRAQLDRLDAVLRAPPPGLQVVSDAVAGLRDHLDVVARRLDQANAAATARDARLASLVGEVQALRGELEARADALADVVGAGGELHDHERRLVALEHRVMRLAPLPVVTSVATPPGVQEAARPTRRAHPPPPSPAVAPEVCMPAELPPSPWFDRVRDAFLDGAASVFVLHGLVQDAHPIDDAEGLRWGALSEAVCARLLPSRDVVLRYDPFHGLRPVGSTARRHLEAKPVEPGLRPALLRISRLLSDRRQSTAVVIDHADLLFPSSQPELPDDRLARSALRHWLDDPSLRESNNILFLIAPQRLQLAAELLAHPRVQAIEVGPHHGPALRAFLRTTHAVDVPLSDDVCLDGPLLARVGALSRLARQSPPASADAWREALLPGQLAAADD